MKLIQKLNEKLRKKYWYSERVYQYVVSGMIGWSITFIVLAIRIIQ